MSAPVDDSTAEAVATGRETLGAVFAGAQSNLRKIFIVFLLGFLAAFYALRIWIWDFLKATAEAEMGASAAEATDVITRSPFEVILLQAKIGLFVGIAVALPVMLFYSRRPLRDRGIGSVFPISKAYVAGLLLTAGGLFVGGVVYAYAVFFPFAFDFLATNAVSAGVKPSFGITEFTEFIALLTISFGLAAQLPLIMSVLAYTEIVPYETFREKWRHAVVGITIFGALFSPPDPFTLVMWAMPLVVLYVFSLGLAKLVTNMRRRGAVEFGGAGTSLVKRRALEFAGVIGVVFAAATGAIAMGGLTYLETSLFPRLPDWFQPSDQLLLAELAADYGQGGPAVAGLVVALGVGFLLLLFHTIRVLQKPVYPPVQTLRGQEAASIDLDVLDVEGIETAPPEVFLELTEEEAMEHARQAMYDDNKPKAQAILDRFDSLNARADTSAQESTEATEEDEEDVVASTAAGILNPFTEDETTEDDIGGYAYDIAFIFNSLTSKMFRIVGVFMLVLGGTFMWLYNGGLGWVLQQFLARVPDNVLEQVAVRNNVDPEGMTLAELIREMDIVIALHPVEVLIFEVKVSTLAAIVTVVPLICYYAWPALKERGLARGDRRVFIVWGGALFGGFALGTYLGFYWIAPSVISYLVSDAISNGMVVSYRIKSFFWLVIFTTIGIGFLANIVVTMALFHISGVVPFRLMWKGWRVVVVAIFTLAAFLSPRGILTMLALGTPVALTYLLGLGLLWVITGGGRLFGGTPPTPDLEQS